MLKVYEWLVYIIMRPHKNFQHLIKCLANYFSTAKQIAEKKTEEKREKKELTWLMACWPTYLAQPTKVFCRLPPLPPKQLAGAAEHAVDATSTPRGFQAAPGLQRAPRSCPRLPLSLSPPRLAFPSLP